MAKNIREVEKKDRAHGSPAFPYTITPNALRRFLEMVPNKPKPPKITQSTLKVWGLKNNNDRSIIPVLKKLELLSASGEPLAPYGEFMKKETGPAALGRQIKRVYGGLFENLNNPEKASHEELKNFFHIHSGGSESSIKYQIDTFKVVASYATFGNSDPLEQPETLPTNSPKANRGVAEGPTVRIDLHIHLPENKTKSDYDAIMESIATHLYRHTSE